MCIGWTIECFHTIVEVYVWHIQEVSGPVCQVRISANYPSFFSLEDKMHFGRLCKLRVRQWTVNPSPPLTTVWSPYSLWSQYGQYGHHTHCDGHRTGSKQEIPCPSSSAVITNVCVAKYQNWESCFEKETNCSWRIKLTKLFGFATHKCSLLCPKANTSGKFEANLFSRLKSFFSNAFRYEYQSYVLLSVEETIYISKRMPPSWWLCIYIQKKNSSGLVTVIALIRLF